MKKRAGRHKTFFSLTKAEHNLAPSRFVVLPAPYERTLSYGKGAKMGPQAIIDASEQVESFDDEFKFDALASAGIYTEKPLSFSRLSEQAVQDLIKGATENILKAKKIPVLLGGEHSVSAAPVAACKKYFNDLSVLQIDAHADLRDSYGGTKFSHASVMRRILEVCPAVQVGIRNISEEGYLFAEKSGQLKSIHFARDLNEGSTKRILDQLSSQVYVTIDIDGLDPGIVPMTGTPEPGGLGWHQILGLLRAVAAEKQVVGFDLVELSPRRGFPASDFACAKLVYKLITYIVAC